MANTDQQQDVIAAGEVKSFLSNLGFQINLVTTTASNIISDFSSKANNIGSGVILYTSRSPIFGYPYLDMQPGWNVYWLPVVPNIDWEYPPSVDAQYQSNFSSFASTNNVTQEKLYLGNTQALNAQYLPTIVLAYPDEVYGISTQHWTNWPQYFVFQGSIFNQSGFANLRPAGQTSTTSTTASSSSPSSSSSSSVSSTSQSTLTSSSSSSSSTNITTNLEIIVAVVVIIVVLGVGLMFRRRES